MDKKEKKHEDKRLEKNWKKNKEECNGGEKKVSIKVIQTNKFEMCGVSIHDLKNQNFIKFKYGNTSKDVPSCET